MIDKELWDKCLEFHGHECPGLAIGYRAALYVQELLDIDFSLDEEIVCVSENDACCIDAIQVITGCTAGKGNLIFHIVGKMAFSFYDRNSGESVRLVLKPLDFSMNRAELFEYIHNVDSDDLFDVKPTVIELPGEAKRYDNVTCSCCGEETADVFIKYVEGKAFCLDCLDCLDCLENE